MRVRGFGSSFLCELSLGDFHLTVDEIVSAFLNSLQNKTAQGPNNLYLVVSKTCISLFLGLITQHPENIQAGTEANKGKPWLLSVCVLRGPKAARKNFPYLLKGNGSEIFLSLD